MRVKFKFIDFVQTSYIFKITWPKTSAEQSRGGVNVVTEFPCV